MIDLGDAFASAFLWLGAICVLVGIGVGALLFLGVPWLWHHVSIAVH